MQTPGLVMARQNLDLIVDGGQPVPGVQDNDPARWGHTVGNAVLVWRSGLGVTADGALVYVAGPGLSAYSLARAPGPGRRSPGHGARHQLGLGGLFHLPARTGRAPAGDLTVDKLLVDMSPSTNNYLTASSRDCIALFAR